MVEHKSAAAIAQALFTTHGKDSTTFNRLLRDRIGKRGDRFTEDHPDTFLYIERSKNANVVAYTARFVDAETKKPVPSGVGRDCIIKHDGPVHAYFITLDPQQMEKLRAKGRTSLIDDLNFVQRKMAYGCSGKSFDVASASRECDNPADFKRWMSAFDPYTLSYVALAKYPTLLLTLKPVKDSNGEENDTAVALIAVIGGELSVVKKIYVSSTEPKHFYELPTVNYIEVFGVSVDKGSDTYEKKTP
ncbi:hypothetical protein DPX39_100019100 [Trypanosoma brucei equiperdum]|uniref:DUF4833 domain-containing protein n=1 Tax=Trypanosoma brucei equiperdum TaxID=630700 RepID=A0A3L6KY04_9TRYP|nr:hypothetical protein DPX39_100019100 [Trypanosoma brucei equiperdum]